MMTPAFQTLFAAQLSEPPKLGAVALCGIGLLVSGALFVLCLVKYFSTRKGGWLGGTIACGLIALGTLGAAIQAGAKAWHAATLPKPAVVRTTPDGAVSLSTPADWLPRTDLNKKAVLQFANGIKEEYLLVLTEPKGDSKVTASDYADVTASNMLKAISEGKRSEPTSFTIDGHPAVRSEITGSVKLHSFAYIHTVIETPTAYYQILMWTLDLRRSSAWPVFEEVLKSVHVGETTGKQ